MIKSQELKKAKQQPKKQSNKSRSKASFDKKWIAILVLVLTSLLGAVNAVYKEYEVVEVPIEIEKQAEPVVIDQSSTLELGDEPTEVPVETENGEVVEELQTVEMVDSNINFGEDKIDGGQGEYFPTGSPVEFANAVSGRCIDQDGYFGSQCWDLSDALFHNLTGRHLSTCNTGAAKGIMNCAEANAGDDFVIIKNPSEIQAGDIMVFDGGRYGHTGMAMGTPANGYVALLSANQGGKACEGGGASVNTVAYSMANFTGAFRYKGWIKVEKPATGHQYIIKEEVK